MQNMRRLSKQISNFKFSRSILKNKNRRMETHCNELEGPLEELQHKSDGSESFIEDSLERSCEDLTLSVLDVQLKGKQKENEELRLALSDAEI